MLTVALGITAGLLQALGYGLYITLSLKHEVRPNASTWFMFAYGTALLTLLEAVSGAELELLVLPIICAALSVLVAALCWRRGQLSWPSDWQDRVAFVADLLLTFLYLSTFCLKQGGYISGTDASLANILFLLLSNATAVSSFAPLLRGAASEEHPLPWLVWTLAYTLLAIATASADGILSPFMIYPVLNAALHAAVVVRSRNRVIRQGSVL